MRKTAWTALAFCLLVSSPVVRATDAGPFLQVNGHKVRVRISGTPRPGLPAVIFESGIGTPSENWGGVQSEIAKETVTLSYDRMGLGSSESDGIPPTTEHIVDNLHAVLLASGIAPPYVMVGHSLGGPILRMYAAQYPKEIAGLVFVDPGDYSSSAKEIAASGLAKEAASMDAMRDEAMAKSSPAVMAEYQEARRMEKSDFAAFQKLAPLPNVPFVVLIATQPLPPPNGFHFDGDFAAFIREGLREHLAHANEWVRSVDEGWLTVTPNSSHYIQNSEPELVVWAIHKTLYPDIDRQLTKAMQAGGADAVVQRYKSIQAIYPADRLSPRPLNHIGYALLRAKQPEDAIKVFAFETEAFPKDWNAFDSLGEAYNEAGQKQLALQAYTRSADLNPKNTNGVNMIQKLKQ